MVASGTKRVFVLTFFEGERASETNVFRGRSLHASPGVLATADTSIAPDEQGVLNELKVGIPVWLAHTELVRGAAFSNVSAGVGSGRRGAFLSIQGGLKVICGAPSI